MRALLFHAPAYTADGYDDTRPRLVRAACKGSDNNVERRDIPEKWEISSYWCVRRFCDSRFPRLWISHTKAIRMKTVENISGKLKV